MFDLDNWQEIWAVLRANRLRTFLTAFGVFWGIFMLMAMLGFGSAMQTAVKKQMKGMATNLLFVWGQTRTEAYDGLPPGRWVRFDLDDIELLRRQPGVEWLAPRIQLGGWMNNFLVSYESKAGSFPVFGDYPELKHIVSYDYEAGRFINEEDIAEQRKVAVIGSKVKEELFGDIDPIGKYLKISGVYFLVVGVTKNINQNDMGNRDAHTVFVPFTTMRRAFNKTVGNHVGFFAMTAKPGTDGPELENQVRTALNQHHRISPTDHLAIGSFNMFVEFGKMSGFFVALYWLSWIVGGATLLAGVVGVSNIMLITVKERTKEIGVRKALGATRRSVIAMVMQESIVLTSIAGLTGIAAGTGLFALVEWIVGKVPDSPLGPPEVSIQTVLTAVVVLVISGALAGIMPASHAASIKPVEALRAE